MCLKWQQSEAAAEMTYLVRRIRWTYLFRSGPCPKDDDCLSYRLSFGNVNKKGNNVKE